MALGVDTPIAQTKPLVLVQVVVMLVTQVMNHKQEHFVTQQLGVVSVVGVDTLIQATKPQVLAQVVQM